MNDDQGRQYVGRYNGLRVECVPAGTVVLGWNGEMCTVTDDNAVFDADTAYVTQPVWDRIVKDIPTTNAPRTETKPVVRQHVWVPSNLGHGENMCSVCKITNREAAVLGQFACDERA